MPSKIQLRRDTATNWFSVNPILSDGELGFETDTLKFKMGDGTTNWNGLDYVIEGSEPALLLTSAVKQYVDSDVDMTGKLDVSGTVQASYLQVAGWIQMITNPSSIISFQKPVEFKGFKESIFDMLTIGNTGWQPQPQNASVYKAVFNGDVDFLGFVQPVEGQTLTLIITQDATGGRLLTVSNTITAKFAGGENLLSTDAGAVDIVNIFYDGACYYISITKGYE